MYTAWSSEAVPEMQYRPELGQYLTYGIQARRKTAQGWEQIEWIHDVTTENQYAINLAEAFTRFQISPAHLREILEDLLR